MPEKYFDVQGVATHLYHTGATTLPDQVPDTSTGQTLLCLHHSGGNGANFSPLMGKLEGRHSSLAFDFPGHHRSGSLDSLGSVEKMAAFVGALIDKLSLGPTVLLGHSMGGSVALEVALTRPVRALVLCASAAKYPESAEMLERYRLITEGKAKRHFDASAYSPSTAKEIIGAGFADSFKTDPRVVYPNLQALRAWEADSRLGEISVPTLVVVGADEGDYMAEQANRIAGQIPGASQVVIEAAGHMIPSEQPGPLSDAVIEFLERLP